MDEVVFLGDMFDFLFGTVAGALAAAEGLFGLLRESLQGKRFVFLAGNHDHHLVRREAEDLLELGIVSDRPAPELREEVRRRSYFRRLLRDRLGGVEVEVRYPAYTFGGVLLTHGHYLDPHARLSGSVGSRALTRLLWSIAAGGREDPRTEEDYESVITLLTELLYTVAQLPHGTIAQRNVYGAVQRAGRLLGAAASPVAAVRRRVEGLRGRAAPGAGDAGPSHAAAGKHHLGAHYRRAIAGERDRRAEVEAPVDELARTYTVARVTRPSDPREAAVEAFARVVENLGWTQGVDHVVFAHTHQPLAGGTARTGPPVRYWNTGSWIYEPELGSAEAYSRYLRNAWPGTAVLIDTDEPEPRLLELLQDLNPLVGGRGAP